MTTVSVFALDWNDFPGWHDVSPSAIPSRCRIFRRTKEDQKGLDMHRIAAPHATVRHGNYALRRGGLRIKWRSRR
jgi:hypothetical protein